MIMKINSAQYKLQIWSFWHETSNSQFTITPDNKVHGAYMGPPGDDKA